MTSVAISSRTFFGVILIASLGALATALIAQYTFGYEPCLLCQYQRIPYWTAAGLATAGLAVPQIDGRGVAWLMASVFAIGAAVAFYHVGVEQHWWQAGACAAQGDMAMSFEDFRKGPLTPITKSCDAIDWTLFGLSMATYNVAVSAVLALGSALAARTTMRG